MVQKSYSPICIRYTRHARYIDRRMDSNNNIKTEKEYMNIDGYHKS